MEEVFADCRPVGGSNAPVHCLSTANKPQTRRRRRWEECEVTQQQVWSLHPEAETAGNSETHGRPSAHLNSPTMGSFSPRLPLLLLFSFFTLSVEVVAASEFKICAYNLERFDSAKASNSRVLHTVKRIVSRCDICLLQNVMDSGAITTLLASLNRYDEYTYQSVSSESLGKSPDDMQRYIFIYRMENVNVTGQHQYQKENAFVRQPFAVQFQSKKTAIKTFILVPLHSDPSHAVQEIDRLYDVFEEVSKKWSNTVRKWDLK
ncbi:deoxyribonuclease-1-like 1 isoform X2 [Anarrhichthys ocellatus]|uniref:deoxyribonuclease-1-like 1 isoform X2 n=1 Tax=Anarrhichthys ocellatus TaxID=433405 RepID=UPI0012EDC097|nr:deoxyribonuclease-1-like 1 isoform X2 [Anarrhichthys ocellatus]